MSQTVIIPTPLRKFTKDTELVEVQGATIGDVFNQLEAAYPGIQARLCETNGELRRFINEAWAKKPKFPSFPLLQAVDRSSTEISKMPMR